MYFLQNTLSLKKNNFKKYKECIHYYLGPACQEGILLIL